MARRVMRLAAALALARAAAAAVAVIVLAPAGPAWAGGAIGWATAVNQFSTEGEAVGALAVVLGILAVGAILMFGITGLITTVVMVCLGGALMAKAGPVAAALFAGGGGGGSYHHVRVGSAPAPTVVTPPAPRG